jgi:predicted acyltransferase
MTEPEPFTTTSPPPVPVSHLRADETIPSPPSASPTKTGERLVSIDALRGFDMFWIMGAEHLAETLCKWWGTPEALRLAEQFEHVEWEGFRFYDLIFPLFIFVVGAVIPFSLSKYRVGAHPGASVFLRIVRRVVLLFVLGLMYNNVLQFPPLEQFRVMGVLQRIAICYGAASILYLVLGVRGRAILFVSILLGYWALFALVPSPISHVKGDYGMETNIAGYVDVHHLPGKPYKPFGDNEGLLSTIPAIATALLGVFAGEWLRSLRSGWSKAGGLFLAGLICLGIGYSWGLWLPEILRFPIIKILWSSSYVLVVGGWSLLLLGLFYTIIDVLKLRAWSFFFVVIGMNAITIYFLPKLIDFTDISRFFLGGLAKMSGPLAGTALVVAGMLLVKWLLLLYLYRRRIFLRL